MKYVGSKNRHSKEILSIILKHRKIDQWYVEPFCGGCNIIDKVKGSRIANDYHPYLIKMWKALVNDNWIPPDIITNEEYTRIKLNMEKEDAWLVGFVGFCCSYSGKWWGGYARGNDKKGKPRNYCLESKKNIMKQIPNLKGVIFKNLSYEDLPIPENSLIYCDPPYENSLGYKNKINHNDFWEWVRKKHSDGHMIFISEYNAPDDFECVWQKKVNNTLVQQTGSKQGVEKLFKLKE